MPNKIYQDLIKADIAALIAESDSIDLVNHKGLRGNIREYGLGKLISKYLPLEWDIGSGQIQDSHGSQSNETDLIIYNKSILPPMMFGENTGLFPLESCRYSFEIKTISTAPEIRSTIYKFRNLKQLNALDNSEIITVYFAYKSDLNLKNELERYKELDENFHNDPAINVICVINQGYWFYKNKNESKRISYWRSMQSLPDNYELACMIGGIINTLNANKPAFGNYLMGEEHNFSDIEHKELDPT